jgi:hypothetical protein
MNNLNKLPPLMARPEADEVPGPAGDLDRGGVLLAGQVASGDTSGNVKDQVVKDRFQGVLQHLGFCTDILSWCKTLGDADFVKSG